MKINKWIWIVLSIVFVTTAQLLLKLSLLNNTLTSLITVLSSTLIGSLKLAFTQTKMPPAALFTTLYFLMGLISYGLSFYCWQRVLRYFPLSKAYSILALSYVSVFYCAQLINYYHPDFAELPTVKQHLAICLIVIGVSLTQRKNSVDKL